MIISRKIELDYGHTLPNSFSFCNQLHGHRGTVVATVEGKIIDRQGDPEEGLVMDFKFLNDIMMQHVHDELDHGFAVWKNDHEDLEFITKRNKRVVITDEPPNALQNGPSTRFSPTCPKTLLSKTSAGMRPRTTGPTTLAMSK